MEKSTSFVFSKYRDTYCYIHSLSTRYLEIEVNNPTEIHWSRRKVLPEIAFRLSDVVAGLVRGSRVAGFTLGSGGFNNVSTITSEFTRIRAIGNSQKIKASGRIGFPTSGLHISRVTSIDGFSSRVQSPRIESLSQFCARVRRKTRSRPLTATHRQVLEDRTTGLLMGLPGSDHPLCLCSSFSRNPSLKLSRSQSFLVSRFLSGQNLSGETERWRKENKEEERMRKRKEEKRKLMKRKGGAWFEKG